MLLVPVAVPALQRLLQALRALERGTQAGLGGRAQQAVLRDLAAKRLQLGLNGPELLQKTVPHLRRQFPAVHAGDAIPQAAGAPVRLVDVAQKLRFDVADGVFHACAVLDRIAHIHAANPLPRGLQPGDHVALAAAHAPDHIDIAVEVLLHRREHPDQLVQRVLRVGSVQQILHLLKHAFDQDAEVFDLDIILGGRGRRGSDLVGDGVRLRVLVEHDGGLLVLQSRRQIVHVAAEVLAHHQRAVIFPALHAVDGLLRAAGDDPADAGGGGDLFHDLRPFVHILAAFQRVAEVAAGQRDGNLSRVGIGIPVGVDVHPGVERRDDQHRQHDDQREKVGHDRPEV